MPKTGDGIGGQIAEAERIAFEIQRPYRFNSLKTCFRASMQQVDAITRSLTSGHLRNSTAWMSTESSFGCTSTGRTVTVKSLRNYWGRFVNGGPRIHL